MPKERNWKITYGSVFTCKADSQIEANQKLRSKFGDVKIFKTEVIRNDERSS